MPQDKQLRNLVCSIYRRLLRRGGIVKSAGFASESNFWRPAASPYRVSENGRERVIDVSTLSRIFFPRQAANARLGKLSSTQMQAHRRRVAIRQEYMPRSPISIHRVDGFEWQTARALRFRGLERGRALPQPGHRRRIEAIRSSAKLRVHLARHKPTFAETTEE